MDLGEAFRLFLPPIDAELRMAVRPPVANLEGYYGMMHYHLGWLDEKLQPARIKNGKRLRPLLCLLASQAAGGDPQQALPAAAAVELIHNFSLIHDDIQDGSDFRRGRRAVWNIWGEAQGINAGDGMFALAHLALQRLSACGVPPERQQAAARVFDQACIDLCQGQFLDMLLEDTLDVELDVYLQMVGYKTAALMAASVGLGAVIASDDPALVEHYHDFGQNLGMAFQFQDDVLGTWGDEAVTGKPVATDIRDKKKTLLVVHVLNHPRERGLAGALAGLYGRNGPLDEAGIDAVLEIMERAGTREYAGGMAKAYCQRALDSLEQTGIDNDAQACLRQLALYLLDRQT
ncbi:MAG: polyprenyl synthetase family protein [Anaerolineae bacterium]